MFVPRPVFWGTVKFSLEDKDCEIRDEIALLWKKCILTRDCISVLYKFFWESALELHHRRSKNNKTIGIHGSYPSLSQNGIYLIHGTNPHGNYVGQTKQSCSRMNFHRSPWGLIAQMLTLMLCSLHWALCCYNWTVTCAQVCLTLT